MATESKRDLVLGTAGHIDHGKSTLVQALTGTDPDRLSEEKQRGITIELGFAQLELPDESAMGVVDVPGHERFVRQMIAGSTGIDVALLCIAADDGIMPQTDEHLAVLQLLAVPTCVVALTKCDLVDEEWALFMEDEVRTRLAGTPYAQAAIAPVSARTGQGLDKLREAIQLAARGTAGRAEQKAMRLPVDRSFTIKGAGTVVTGTLWSGIAHVGDEVEVLPSGLRTRIRGIQVHEQAVEQASSGHRTALNLNAVTTDDVRPGSFICTPDAVTPTDHFDVDITYLGLPDQDKPLETGCRVHVAHGTTECIGRVLLMDGAKSIPRGQTATAQIRTERDLPVAYGDRFVIRSYSPVHVIGGGVVLRAHPKRTTTVTQADRALLDALRTGNGAKAVQAAFDAAEFPPPISPMQPGFPLPKPHMSLKRSPSAAPPRSWPGPRARATDSQPNVCCRSFRGRSRTRCFASIAQIPPQRAYRKRRCAKPACPAARPTYSMRCLHAHARKAKPWPMAA